MENETIKHTPEPWKAKGSYIQDSNERFIVVEPIDTTIEDDVFNVARIVECVNALAGIPEPKKWVEDKKLLTVQIESINEAVKCSNAGFLSKISELQSKNERQKTALTYIHKNSTEWNIKTIAEQAHPDLKGEENGKS